MNVNHSPRRFGIDLPAVLYIATIGAFLAGAFYPEGRVWGFNWWAYWPDWVAPLLFLAGLGLILPCGSVGAIGARSESVIRRSGARLSSRLGFTAISLAYPALFYFLRAKTHFLGDGYGQLKLLTSNESNYLQVRELGESLAHLGAKLVMGGTSEIAALASFQAVSILAGVILLSLLYLFARRLFIAEADRILFTAGIATGGYMLLYFGYVENYSLLVLATVLFTLVGLLVSLGKLNRWLVLPAVALPIFFHIIAVVMLPGAAFLLVSGGRPKKLLAGIPVWLRAALIAACSFLLMWLFYRFYTANYFFRYAIVPLVENRVTAEGYTLFSLNHLTDFANLLLLLIPGLPLLLVSLMSAPIKKLARERSFRFLLISLVSSLVACFAIDPRLGMPRDWDLLSFSGVPLAVLLYFLVLKRAEGNKRYRTHAALSVVLGLMVLLPRAISQASPEVAMAHINSYSRLDQSRYLFSDLLLKTYYEQRQDTESASKIDSIWDHRYPEKGLFERATLAKQAGQYVEAIGLFRRVLYLNPSYANAYNNLGNCFRAAGQLDSALEYHLIANGLRPYNAPTLYNLGLTYAYTGDILRAEQALLRSHRLDGAELLTILALVSAYKQLNKVEEYQRFLKVAAIREDAPPMILKEMGDLLASAEDRGNALAFYRKAINRGLDPAIAKEIIRLYPALKP